MPRRRPPRAGEHRSGAEPSPWPVAPTRRESDPDGEDWLVRAVPGAAAGKPYRCPGCDQLIPPGTPHVVAWPDLGSVTDRRHWHTPCWTTRQRRRPGGRRR